MVSHRRPLGPKNETSTSTGFPRAEATYAFCATLFVVSLVLTNILARDKLFVVPEGLPYFGGKTLTSGILTFTPSRSC